MAVSSAGAGLGTAGFTAGGGTDGAADAGRGTEGAAGAAGAAGAPGTDGGFTPGTDGGFTPGTDGGLTPEGGLGADGALGGAGAAGADGAGTGFGGRLIIAVSRGVEAAGCPSRLGGRTMRTVSFFGSLMVNDYSLAKFRGWKRRNPELFPESGMRVNNRPAKLCPCRCFAAFFHGHPRYRSRVRASEIRAWSSPLRRA